MLKLERGKSVFWWLKILPGDGGTKTPVSAASSDPTHRQQNPFVSPFALLVKKNPSVLRFMAPGSLAWTLRCFSGCPGRL